MLPKKVYRIELLPGESGKLGYRSKGGGYFQNLKSMQTRRYQLDCANVKYKVHVSELNWEEVLDEQL